MYKPSVNLYEYTFIVIWIVTQRVCFSLLEKCSHLQFMNSAQGSIQKGWDIIETTRGQGIRQSLEMNPFPISTLDHRNNVRQSWKKLSRDSHSFPKEISPQAANSFLGKILPQAFNSSCPFLSERCSKTWKRWRLDKMIKRLHHREHKCKHYPWVCSFAVKVQYKPFSFFFFAPQPVPLLGLFLFVFFCCHCSFIKAHTIKYVQREEVRNVWKHLKKSKCET